MDRKIRWCKKCNGTGVRYHYGFLGLGKLFPNWITPWYEECSCVREGSRKR